MILAAGCDDPQDQDPVIIEDPCSAEAMITADGDTVSLAIPECATLDLTAEVIGDVGKHTILRSVPAPDGPEPAGNNR